MQKFLFVFFLVALINAWTPCDARVWWPTGNALNVDAAHNAATPSMYVDNNTPYVVWQESSLSAQNIYVKYWTGTQWSQLGSALNIRSALNASLFVYNGTPYVAWQEWDVNFIYQIYVKVWNGVSWVSLGGALNMDITKNATIPSLSVYNGTPYVAWQEDTSTVKQIYVKHWTGSTWVQDGSGSLNVNAARNAINPSLFVSTGKPYVTWAELSASQVAYQIYVKSFNGVVWSSLGGSLNVDSTVTYSSGLPSICLGDTITPYVAWGENNGSVSQVYAKRWDGSNWIQLGGTLNFDNTKDAHDPQMSINNTVPFVTWHETNGTNTQVYVKHWGLTQWAQDAGSLNISVSRDATVPSIGFSSSGVAYVAWQESNGTAAQIYVKQEDFDRISHVDPTYNTGGIRTLTVAGANIYGTPFAKLTHPGWPDISSSATVLNSATSFNFTFDLTSTTPGTYHVKVIGADAEEAVLKQAFTILSPGSSPYSWYVQDLGQIGSQTTLTYPVGLKIGDADGDDHQELYIANQDQRLFKFSYSSSAWSFSAVTASLGQNFGRVELADGNRDQGWEVYGGTTSNNHLYQFSYAAGWQTNDLGSGYTNANKITALTQADVKHDGVMRIYSAGTDAGVNTGISQFQFNGTSWAVSDIPGCPSNQANDLTSGTGKNDGETALYSANADGSIYQYKYNGTSWQVAVVGTGTDIMYAVAVGDGDNDGQKEVYGANKNGKVYQFRWNGAVWSTQTIGTTVSATLFGLAVTDADNDGNDEVYTISGDGHAYVYKKSGSVWNTTDMGNAGTPLFAMAAGDADNDGRFELYALGQNNHVYQFRTGVVTPPTPTVTPTQPVIVVPTVTPTPTPFGLDKFLKIYHSKINPNRDEKAQVRWAQPQTAPVTITVYDMVGNKIITLVDHQTYPAGQFNIVEWDGHNSNGGMVGSGIYIVHIKTDGYETYSKVAVVK